MNIDTIDDWGDIDEIADIAAHILGTGANTWHIWRFKPSS